jgi:hypothetical protein
MSPPFCRAAITEEPIMTTTNLEKAAWHAYFDSISRALVGKRAEIEVDSLRIVEQLEAEWLPFYGMSYDTQNDTMEVVLEGVDHIIDKPREVQVELDPVGMLNSVAVLDGGGARQVVKLRDPLMLPPPSGT